MPSHMELAREGDPLAVHNLVEVLRPRITRMARHYARVCGEDADDLLQSAWVGLLEALRDVDLGIGSPEQYLIQRARWRLLDDIKRARVRRCDRLPEEASDRLSAPVEDMLSPSVVAEFMDCLTDTQRTVVRLLLRGMTWREAGDAMGCTSANIAYHVRQVRKRYETWSRPHVGGRRHPVARFRRRT